MELLYRKNYVKQNRVYTYYVTYIIIINSIKNNSNIGLADSLLKAMYRTIKEQSVKLDNVIKVQQTILQEIRELKTRQADSGLRWPVLNREHLDEIENKLKCDKDFEQILKSQFSTGNRTTLPNFIRDNIHNLFKNCGRWTWTGRPANNVTDSPQSCAASKLLAIRVLKGKFNH